MAEQSIRDRRAVGVCAQRRVSVRVSVALATLLAATLTALPAGAVSVSATVDRTRLAVGESAQLSITIEGVQNAPAPSLGQMAGFQAQYQGPATQVSWVNGRMSASVTHRYVLVARQVGEFTIGPVEVDTGGGVQRTAPIRMQVTAQPQPAAGQASRAVGGAGLPWLVVLPAKQEAYAGERIPLTVKLYIGRTKVDQLQFPKIAGEGFVLDQLPQPVERQEVVGGVPYRVLVFETNLTPMRAGDLVVGPATMGMVQLVSRRSRDAFNDFFGDVFAERRAIEAQGEAVTMNVLPLPEEGRPPAFSGAVGRYDLALDVKPTELNAGDPITVRMQISGQGNVAAVDAPRVPVDDRFRAYDPMPVKEEETPGRRVFEQVVIPREPGLDTLPPVSISFFDPESRSYRTVTRGPVALTVRGAPMGAAAPAKPQVLLPAEEARPEPTPEKLGRDIVYIKGAPGPFRRMGGGFERSWWFLLLQLVPAGAFVVLVVHVGRRERFRADPRLLRFRQAGKETRRALAALSRAGSAEPAFYDRLSEAMYAYLGAKLDLPPGAVERERVVARLDGACGGGALRGQVESYFDLVERVRYAGGPAARTEQADALRMAGDIIDRMEKERRLARQLGNGAAAAVLCAVLSGVVMTAVAQNAPGAAERLDPNAAFYTGNAAYSAERYNEAVANYRRIVESGLESGALHFNLANACFKSGQLGEAVINYERARRLLPRDPDVASNLRYARELAEDGGRVVPLWEKLLFPLATRATTRELTVACSILWWVLWALLSARLVLPRQRIGLSRAAIAAGLILVVAAGSLVMRMTTVDWRRIAVVTTPGPVAVRFEPAETGTAHFEVKEGVSLEVTDEQDGWLQVRRADGRRGWIPAASVGLV